jgi:hypothetical protein
VTSTFFMSHSRVHWWAPPKWQCFAPRRPRDSSAKRIPCTSAGNLGLMHAFFKRRFLEFRKQK